MIPADAGGGVVNDRSFACFLLDEAVMSSMLAFSAGPPPLRRYLMEDDPACAVIRFGGQPKPWRRWLLRNMEYFDEVTGLLEWAEEQGWKPAVTPAQPHRKNKIRYWICAFFFEMQRYFRRSACELRRKFS
ncbi:MAG: hypothetical protein WC334_05195 [Kiritimatiellales bacterium]